MCQPTSDWDLVTAFRGPCNGLFCQNGGTRNLQVNGFPQASPRLQGGVAADAKSSFANEMPLEFD